VGMRAFSNIRPQRLLPRGSLPHTVQDRVDAHVENGPADSLASMPAHDPTPHVVAHDDLPARSRGCR
ncbi:unnamed protein product, partial [Ilex paraguariensis]